jgi:hypothetical protein
MMVCPIFHLLSLIYCLCTRLDIAYLYCSLGSDLAESFYFIPSTNTVRTSGSSTAPAADVHLRKENASLKADIEAMQRRLAQTERVLQMRREQDQQLKDSIVLARQQACFPCQFFVSFTDDY